MTNNQDHNPNRVRIKTTFDSAFGSLITLGVAGLGFGVYNQDLISGLFGVLCILVAIILNYSRNKWNAIEKRVVRRLK